MSITFWMLAAFGLGALFGFSWREVHLLFYYKTETLKAQREAAADLAYDKAVEESEEEFKEGLPDPEAVNEDQPEQEDEWEKEKRRGTPHLFG